MLQICPNLPGQKFVDPPFKEEILTFIKKLSYSGNTKSLSNAKKNVDYVYLLWEDLVYQIENKEAKKNKDMYYPRFIKVTINHFMSKDQSILRRNKVDWHMANDDPILTTMRFIPKHETVQKYDVILPDNLTNQAMKESDAYNTYYDFATRKVIPKPNGSGAHEGFGVIPGVLDVPTYDSDDEQISWKSSDDEDDVDQDDDNADDEDNDDQDDDNVDDEDHDGQDDDNEHTESQVVYF
nr:hypothetical protein [Tanacetum cinerariifolium]